MTRSDTGYTFVGMKTISIKELHAATGKWVRAAKREIITVTDHGERIAELRPITVSEKPRVPFDPAQRLKWMPVSKMDSTVFISEDRDGR